MNGVGGQDGQAHHLNQGQGLATVLDSTEHLKYAYMYEERKRKKGEELKTKKDAALKGLMSYNPEYFIRHDGELKTDIDAVVNDGAQLMSAGVDDLWSSQDPRAVEWRKRYTRTDQMAKMSKQVKDQWSKYQDDINKAGANDFDAKTLDAANQYFNTPLSEIVDKGILPPNLIKKYAYLDAFKMVGENVAAMERKLNGKVPTDAELMDFTRSMVMQPANSEPMARAYGNKFTQMGEFERQDVQRRAAEQGVPEHLIMAFDDAKRWQNKGKPFDLLAEITSAAGKVNPSKVTVSTPDGGSSYVDKAKLEKQAEIVAMAAFNSRSDWMTAYDEDMPREEEETDGEYAQRVIRRIKQDIINLTPQDRSSTRTASGQQKRDDLAMRNAWIEDMRTNDPRARWAASQWMTGGKIFQNLDVEWSNIGEENGVKFVEMKVATPLQVKELTEEVDMGNGIVKEQDVVSQADGSKLVRFEFANDGIANQYLASLYDKIYKSRGQNYDPKLTERTPNSAADLIQKTPLAPQNGGRKDNLFKKNGSN